MTVDIDQMPAGIELDVLVAEALGYVRVLMGTAKKNPPGVKTFVKLTGKRQCVFCGTEFEVDGEGITPIPMVVCDFDGRTSVGACFDYNSTGSREQDVGFKPDIIIVKRSEPGVAAKEWDSLNHRLGAIKQNWQLVRRYCQGDIS